MSKDKENKEDKELNIVKKTCKELGLTYRQLGEIIGYEENSLRSIASSDNISLQIQKSIALYLETKSLKEQLKELEQLKTILRNLIK